MVTKTFKGDTLSALGLGTMRLPTIDGDDHRIDEAQTAEMIAYALEHGINYFDTAWGYHGGESERVVGRLLHAYPRESFYLASKFPGFNLDMMGRVEEIFEEQLKKCQVEYFDYYLFHNVCEKNIDGYVDRQYGVMDYLLEQKKNGRIRHLGFSVHGDLNVMRRFLDAYGEHMEFCQIQLNYLDWTLQNAKGKVELLAEYGLPVWVMEPLRGGRLAHLADEDVAALAELRPDESVPGWAFRFLQSLPTVTMTLSGMSNMQQLRDNIATYEQDLPLNASEREALLGVADRMLEGFFVPCTACRYCTARCPQGLDIPNLLRLYNDRAFGSGGFIAPMVVGTLPEDKRPTACIGCRSCEAVCPQNIRIAETMANFVRLLQPKED